MADANEAAKKLWEKYLMLTSELLKFINKKDIDMFIPLVSQRDKLIAMLEALPENNFRASAEGQAIINKIRPMDMQIIYKAKSWLNKSKRQNLAVRSYDLTSDHFSPVGNIVNRKY